MTWKLSTEIELIKQLQADFELKTVKVEVVVIMQARAEFAKYHQTQPIVFAQADTWQDIPWNVAPESENTTGFTLIDLTTVKTDFAAHLQIGGCVRPYFTGPTNTSVVTATRILYSHDDGLTWIESRCLQAVAGRNRQELEVGTQRYMGSLSAQAGTRFKLQARASNVLMELRGWDEFDSPVSASINVFCSGYIPNEEA